MGNRVFGPPPAEQTVPETDAVGASRPSRAGPVAPAGRSRWWVLGWLVPMAVQLGHSAVVAPIYHVGSFDDDANYLMAAHVLASGGGLTTTMPSGVTVVANYLPGYPLLLVPFIWVWGAALWPSRLLSLLCIEALYPLMWVWMGRRGMERPYRAAVLGLLAMNAVVATYSTMVMAEAPFLLGFVLVLFALDHWERRPGWPRAAVVAVLLAELVWLKEAGIGLAVGAVAYEAWRRRGRAAAGLALGVGVLLLPGLVARWVSGGATVGNRYAGEISNTGQGGLLHQLPSEVVRDAWAYLQDVLRQSVLPFGSPVPYAGPVHALVAVLGASVPVLVVVGATVWYRRHPGAESWMLWAYFAETLGYPYTNQRRVILVLPLVVVWYVVGAGAAGRYVLGLGGRATNRAAVLAGVVVAVLAVGSPTAFAFGQDYLYTPGQQSAEFAHSPAMSLLKAVGTGKDVVETDYRGTVAYFTGHKTAWSAFVNTTPYGPFAAQNRSNCTVAIVNRSLHADDAKFVVIGNFNIPGLVDSPCLLKLASSGPTARAIGAVRLLSTDHDNTSVFELLGPGSSQPGLVDRTAGTAPTSPAAPRQLRPNGRGDVGGRAYAATAASGRAVFEWTWPAESPVSQLSVGSVTSSGRLSGTMLALRLPGGKWETVASAPGPVGDGGATGYLVSNLPPGTEATGVRVVAQTTGTAVVGYVNAIGPAR